MDVLQIQKDLIGMQDYMKNFARSLTKDEADAEDLTQDTTLRVLNNYDKFVDNVNFKGWVLKIMRNIFINNYHKLVRTQELIDYNVDAYNVPLMSDGGENTPEGSMDIKEITEAISALQPTLKEPCTSQATSTARSPRPSAYLWARSRAVSSSPARSSSASYATCARRPRPLPTPSES